METGPAINQTSNSKPEGDILIEQYKSYLNNLNEIGSHHTTTRAFYVSIISALLVFISLTGENGGLVQINILMQSIISVFGIILCVAWYYHIKSFGILYRTKFDILRDMESITIESTGSKVLYPIFTKEKEMLFGAEKEPKTKEDPRKKYSKFTNIESLICILLILPFGLILI